MPPTVVYRAKRGVKQYSLSLEGDRPSPQLHIKYFIEAKHLILFGLGIRRRLKPNIQKQIK